MLCNTLKKMQKSADEARPTCKDNRKPKKICDECWSNLIGSKQTNTSPAGRDQHSCTRILTFSIKPLIPYDPKGKRAGIREIPGMDPSHAADKSEDNQGPGTA